MTDARSSAPTLQATSATLSPNCVRTVLPPLRRLVSNLARLRIRPHRRLRRLGFRDHGLIVDLKTTERLPSAISISRPAGRRLAKAHGNYGMRFAYVKPGAGKKDGRAVVVYEMSADDVRPAPDALHQIRCVSAVSSALLRSARARRPAGPRLRALLVEPPDRALARSQCLRLLITPAGKGVTAKC